MSMSHPMLQNFMPFPMVCPMSVSVAASYVKCPCPSVAVSPFVGEEITLVSKIHDMHTQNFLAVKVVSFANPGHVSRASSCKSWPCPLALFVAAGGHGEITRDCQKMRHVQMQLGVIFPCHMSRGKPSCGLCHRSCPPCHPGDLEEVGRSRICTQCHRIRCSFKWCHFSNRVPSATPFFVADC